MMDILKPLATYAVTAGLSAVASRYHLSGDQVMMITTDLATLGAGAYGVYSHWVAAQTDPKGGTK